MTRKKILIATGGTGGHVFPAYSLARYLISNNFNVQLTIDKRGAKYLKNQLGLNLIEIPSSRLQKENILKILLSILIIFLSILRSLFFLIFNRPSIIIGMGGYSSFPVCIAASILRIKYLIYESNLIIGKTNKYLLPFARKIFVSYKGLEGIPKKYEHKIIEIGNIIREEILNTSSVKQVGKYENMNILVLGGSQAAKIFADELPKIFERLKKNKIPIKIYQQCLIQQNEQLSEFYKRNEINFELFNFTDNILNYYSKSNLVITRAGASVLGELINIKIPFIAIPLPTSADNHQYKNAEFYEKKGYGYLMEEKDIRNKLYNLINSMFNDKSNLNSILSNQRQYSDKDILKNLTGHIKKILNEKN